MNSDIIHYVFGQKLGSELMKNFSWYHEKVSIIYQKKAHQGHFDSLKQKNEHGDPSFLFFHSNYISIKHFCTKN